MKRVSKPIIALFIRSLNIGGAEKQSILLTHALKKYYQTSLIVIYQEGKLIDFAKKYKIDNIYYLRGANIFLKAIDLYFYLKKNKIEVLINFLPINNIIGIIIGYFAGIKFSFAGLRGSMIKANRYKMLLLKFLCNRFSTAVISNSYAAKQVYSNFGIFSNKIVVIHNGIEINGSKIIRKNNRRINILSVGRFIYEKDFITALESVKKLTLLSTIDFHYNIIGYGNQINQIRKYIYENELTEFVTIYENTMDVSSFYLSADIYLLTSIYEGMPNTVLEAMSFSLPVVSTNVGDISYLIKEGINGHICATKETDCISKCLYNLLKSYDRRIRYGLQSYNIVRTQFSISSSAYNYNTLINNYLLT